MIKLATYSHGYVIFYVKLLPHSLMGNWKPNTFFKSVDCSWSWQLLLWHVYVCTGETGEASVCWWNKLFLSSAREQSFPRGMTQPHAVGCQPENSGKNRFKKLCACEYSRYNFSYPEVQFVCVLTHLCQAEVVYFAKKLLRSNMFYSLAIPRWTHAVHNCMPVYTLLDLKWTSTCCVVVCFKVERQKAAFAFLTKLHGFLKR